MTDQELKLECLKEAVSIVRSEAAKRDGNMDVVKLAKEFYTFVSEEKE